MTTATLHAATRPKRTYTRLSDEDWQRVVDLYSAGGLTLAEIATRYGVSIRAIQIYIDKAKPATPAPSASAPMARLRLLTPSVLTPTTHARCITETKASAYADAAALQALLVDALATIKATTGLPATACVRACDQAAVALERIHKIRRMALGIGKEDDVAERPLPELPIRELTAREVEAIRNRQEAEDSEYDALPSLPDEQDADCHDEADDDGIVVEE